jgi:membrane associated rhomboid family serine protease
MLALVPLSTELERIMGSVRLLFLMFLLATINAILHLIIAFLVAYNPLHPVSYLVDECSIGFSGVIFSMIVIETSLSGVQSRRCVDFLVIIILNSAIITLEELFIFSVDKCLIKIEYVHMLIKVMFVNLSFMHA